MQRTVDEGFRDFLPKLTPSGTDLLKAQEATHFFPQEAQPLLARTGH